MMKTVYLIVVCYLFVCTSIICLLFVCDRFVAKSTQSRVQWNLIFSFSKRSEAGAWPRGLRVLASEYLVMIFELVRERAKRRCVQISRIYSVSPLSGPVTRSLSGSDA